MDTFEKDKQKKIKQLTDKKSANTVLRPKQTDKKNIIKVKDLKKAEKKYGYAEVKELSKAELKTAISELPKPSFNNPEKAQPKVEIPKLIQPNTGAAISSFSGIDEKKQSIIDAELIISKPGNRVEKLQPNKRKTSIFKTILKYAKKYWYLIVFAFLFALVNSVLELIIPIFIGDAIDLMVGVNEVQFKAIFKILVYLVFSTAGFAIFKWLTNYTSNLLAYKTAKHMRNDLYKKFNKVPVKYIDGISHGDLQSRMINDIEQVTDGFLSGLTTFFDALCSIVFLLIVMFSKNVTIASVIVGLTPISIAVTTIIVQKTYKFFKHQAKALGDVSGNITEMLGNQRIVEAFNYEKKSIEKFSDLNDNLSKYSEKSMFYSSVTNPCARFVNGIVYAVVAILGTIFAMKGLMSIGAISILTIYANKYIKPFNDISDVITELQAAVASARRVFNVMDIENEPSDADLPVLKTCDGSVTMKDVAFSYVQNKPLIENLNVSVEPGERVAIVGPTGCGKSTLINLLMRFYDITNGDILLKDSSIYKIKRESLRAQFGMVLQDTWLFSASIKDNINYGKQEASMDEIIEAAKNAHAHDFINTLVNGYDTMLTENGDNLSQGQRQLICIARLMLTKPKMLILDEATSNIDTRTELLIQEAFNNMMKGRTSFVVAHRLSTIVASNLILVMNKGNIIEQGTHEELLNKKGFYYALYNSQFSKV